MPRFWETRASRTGQPAPPACNPRTLSGPIPLWTNQNHVPTEGRVQRETAVSKGERGDGTKLYKDRGIVVDPAFSFWHRHTESLLLCRKVKTKGEEGGLVFHMDKVHRGQVACYLVVAGKLIIKQKKKGYQGAA